MKIVITGGRGQLGTALAQVFSEEEVYSWGREELDFTQPRETLQRICAVEPELILHCGAMTNVKGCEVNPEQAFLVNTLGARNVALAAGKSGARMVYFSTDYVFDGKKRTPYLEYDPVNPVNVYGYSKLMGEEIVQTLLPQAYIIRTAWLYSEGGCNFAQTMLRLAAEGKIIRVVDDQWGTPTYVRDLAEAVKVIVSEPFYGTYHVSASGACTWFDFAKEIFHQLHVTPELIRVTSEEYGDLVHRPVYSVLDKLNLQATYGYTMRDWWEGLSACLGLMADPEGT